MRRQRIAKDKAILAAPKGQSTSKTVFEARNITKFFERISICKNFSTCILKGDRVEIFGANGFGKSTLIKILLKQHPPL